MKYLVSPRKKKNAPKQFTGSKEEVIKRVTAQIQAMPLKEDRKLTVILLRLCSLDIQGNIE